MFRSLDFSLILIWLLVKPILLAVIDVGIVIILMEGGPHFGTPRPISTAIGVLNRLVALALAPMIVLTAAYIYPGFNIVNSERKNIRDFYQQFEQLSNKSGTY